MLNLNIHTKIAYSTELLGEKYGQPWRNQLLYLVLPRVCLARKIFMSIASKTCILH